MDSTMKTDIDLFGGEMLSFEEMRTLSLTVNSSELNRIAFAEKVDAGNGKALQTGIGLFILGRYDEAVKNLGKAAKCKEKFIYLGYAQSKLGQYDEAIKSFDEAAKSQADSLMVALAKAETYRLSGETAKAEKALKGCGNFENVSAEYHYQLGRLKDVQGLYGEAIANYEKAIELDPSHRDSMFQLAFACDLHGDDETAMDYYKKLARSTPVHVNALLNLSVMYEDEGDYDRASLCVETVLGPHPNHQRALLFYEDIESSKVMYYDEEKAKRKDRHNKTLEIPLTDFELSVRSRNCLKKMKIYTLGDLLRISESELLSYKNFGETSLDEIKEILDLKGLTLGASTEDEDGNPTDSNSEGLNEELLGKPIDDLELSVRAKRALIKLGLRTVGDLVSKTEAELLGCKNFGVTSLQEIQERLTVYGASLRTLE